MQNKTSWYQKHLAIVALLFLFAPAGVFLMWKYTNWGEKKKGALTVISLILFLGVFGGSKKPLENKQSVLPTPTVEKELPVGQENEAPVPPSKEITYEITKRWQIPNGGEGKDIVIAPEYFNEADMPLVGSKIKEDTKSDRNAFVFVFTDQKAAKMRDIILTDKVTEADRDFYDKHYVGQYNKNGNSGFDEFIIYYDGVMGSNSKTIKY